MIHIPLTPQIDEAGNGILAAYCLAAALFSMNYLLRARRQLGVTRKLWTYENKAAVGMFTMFVGLSIKLSSEWWYLHLISHGHHANYPLLLPLFLVGTLTSVWGLFCLLRSLSRFDWNPYAWTAGALAIVALSIWLAL